jgi:hypothetical protein
MFCDVSVRVPRFADGCIGSNVAFDPPVDLHSRARLPASKNSQSKRGAFSVLRSALALLTTGSTNNSAFPEASAFSRSRPVLRHASRTVSAVRRLFAARGSFAFDFGALSVIVARCPLCICFSTLPSAFAWNRTSSVLAPLSCMSASASSDRAVTLLVASARCRRWSLSRKKSMSTEATSADRPGCIVRR